LAARNGQTAGGFVAGGGPTLAASGPGDADKPQAYDQGGDSDGVCEFRVHAVLLGVILS
jgi:hypothetical protein